MTEGCAIEENKKYKLIDVLYLKKKQNFYFIFNI